MPVWWPPSKKELEALLSLIAVLGPKQWVRYSYRSF